MCIRDRLIAVTGGDLHWLLYRFNNVCKQHTTKVISSAKIKATTVASTAVRCKFVIDNETVEQIMEVKRIGSEASSEKSNLDSQT